MSDTWIGTTVLTEEDEIYSDEGEKVFDLLERNGQEVLESEHPILFMSDNLYSGYVVNDYIEGAIATDELKTSSLPTGINVTESTEYTGTVSYDGSAVTTSGYKAFDLYGYLKYTNGIYNIPDVTSDWSLMLRVYNSGSYITFGTDSFEGSAEKQRITVRHEGEVLSIYISGHGIKNFNTGVTITPDGVVYILRHENEANTLHIDIYSEDGELLYTTTTDTTNLPANYKDTIILGATYDSTYGAIMSNLSIANTFIDSNCFLATVKFITSKQTPDPTGRTQYKVIADKTETAGTWSASRESEDGPIKLLYSNASGVSGSDGKQMEFLPIVDKETNDEDEPINPTGTLEVTFNCVNGSHSVISNAPTSGDAIDIELLSFEWPITSTGFNDGNLLSIDVKFSDSDFGIDFNYLGYVGELINLLDSM